MGQTRSTEHTLRAQPQEASDGEEDEEETLEADARQPAKLEAAGRNSEGVARTARRRESEERSRGREH